MTWKELILFIEFCILNYFIIGYIDVDTLNRLKIKSFIYYSCYIEITKQNVKLIYYN